MSHDGREHGTYTIKEAQVIRETDKALLIRAPELVVDTWFPKGQVSDDSEVYESGHKGEFVVTEWVAKEKGLI